MLWRQHKNKQLVNTCGTTCSSRTTASKQDCSNSGHLVGLPQQCIPGSMWACETRLWPQLCSVFLDCCLKFVWWGFSCNFPQCEAWQVKILSPPTQRRCKDTQPVWTLSRILCPAAVLSVDTEAASLDDCQTPEMHQPPHTHSRSAQLIFFLVLFLERTVCADLHWDSHKDKKHSVRRRHGRKAEGFRGWHVLWAGR